MLLYTYKLYSVSDYILTEPQWLMLHQVNQSTSEAEQSMATPSQPDLKPQNVVGWF